MATVLRVRWEALTVVDRGLRCSHAKKTAVYLSSKGTLTLETLHSRFTNGAQVCPAPCINTDTPNMMLLSAIYRLIENGSNSA